jgi:outer membrane protein assembly factor BamE
MKRVLALALAISVAACSYLPNLSPHRMEIQQGNFISQEMLSQLKPGMTKDQVRFILGTPLVTDVFHADRWDYVFSRRRANTQAVEQRHIAVHFEDGKLKRVDGDVVAKGESQGAAGGAAAGGTRGTP